MKVYLTPEQWEDLNVDKHELFVRSAFYLGLPTLYIQLRSGWKDSQDRDSTIESALELGMTDRDVLIKLKSGK